MLRSHRLYLQFNERHYDVIGKGRDTFGWEYGLFHLSAGLLPVSIPLSFVFLIYKWDRNSHFEVLSLSIKHPGLVLY